MMQSALRAKGGRPPSRLMREIIALIEAGYQRDEIRQMVSLGDIETTKMRNQERIATVKKENRRRRLKFEVYYLRALKLIERREIEARPALPEQNEDDDRRALTAVFDHAACQEETASTGGGLTNHSQWDGGLGSANPEGPFVRMPAYKYSEDAALREIKTLICDFIQVPDRDYISHIEGQIITNRVGEAAERLYIKRKQLVVVDHLECFRIAVESIRDTFQDNERLYRYLRRDLMQVYADKFAVKVFNENGTLSKTLSKITQLPDNTIGVPARSG
jgi:hypothetical protein